MNKYTKTYLKELSQKTAADPYTPPTVMGVPYSNRGGLFGRGGLLNPNTVSRGVPPSRRVNYMGSSQPSILGSAASSIGNQVSSAFGNITGLATNPMVNPAAALGAAGKAIGGGLGTMFGGAVDSIGKQFEPKSNLNSRSNSSLKYFTGEALSRLKSQQDPYGLKQLDIAKSINAPAPQMRTSLPQLRGEKIPNGQMIMPSEQQMINEGEMDLANYGPGSVSGPDALTPLGNKMKQNLYKIDPNTGKALPPPPPLNPVGG
jgi:hypothetical protein